MFDLSWKLAERSQLRRLMSLLILLICASTLSAGCVSSEPSSRLPLGDDLDNLLIFVATPGLLSSSVFECLGTQGLSVSRDDVNRLISPMSQESPPVDRLSDGSSGITKAAILQLDPTFFRPDVSLDTGAEEIELDQRLQAAVYEPIEFGGERYEGGCLEYGYSIVQASEAERARLILQEEYVDNVSVRLTADLRWIAADAQWSECMAANGFDGLERPGDQLRAIVERVATASGELAKLEEILEFDKSITEPAVSCFADIAGDRQEVRREYELKFVEQYRPDIERLILLIQEDQRS